MPFYYAETPFSWQAFIDLYRQKEGKEEQSCRIERGVGECNL